MNKQNTPTEPTPQRVDAVAEAVPVDETDRKIIDDFALVVFDGDTEPRALDTDIAERAELAQPRNVRQVIEKNREELEEHGALVERTVRVRSGNLRGSGEVFKEVPAYYLNEDQAYNLLALLKTEPAKRFRPFLIKTFRAYRHGELPPDTIQVSEDDSLVTILAKHTDAKLAKLNAKVANVVAEQERIEREAIERDEATRKSTEETLRKSKEDLYESVATRKYVCPPRPDPSQIPMFSEDGTKVMGYDREAEITTIRRDVAFQCALEVCENPRDLPKYQTWADSLAQAWTRDALGFNGKMVMQPFSTFIEIKVYLRDKRTKQAIVDWMTGRSIPVSSRKPAAWAVKYCRYHT